MDKINKETVDIAKENIEKLKELFPNIINDGKIDFDQLKTVLGEELDEPNERYQFTWNGKKDSIKLAQTTSTGTLRPSKDDSINWDTTENLYIEGDNLEVLKQLQKTYFGKIKMIYIDPPYNTGGDFVYKDNFKDNIKNYKELTNQQLRSNPETSGRYHTDWLNMMYPRLMLARNLLAEDGVIFVSIDDNEVENLKKLMNEIFGESNFISQMPRKTVGHLRVLADYELQKLNDYVLLYTKNKAVINFKKNVTGTINYEYEDENGKYTLKAFQNSGANGTRKARPNLYYPIYLNRLTQKLSLVNSGNDLEILPKKVRNEDGRWLWSKEKFNTDKELLVYVNNTIKKKYYYDENEDQTKYQAKKTWLEIFENRLGTNALKKLNMVSYFNYSKPVELIEYLIEHIFQNDLIILDFFSGSATTAHAVMKLNAEDGGNRKFIMVQLPEKTDESSEAYKAGYENICEIGKERIRRAGKQIKEELEKEGKDTSSLDIGFKVFKLDETNIKEWDAYEEVTEQTLFNQEQVLKDGRSKDDLLYEILLKYGVFDKKVKEITVNNKKMVSVGENSVILDLSDSISLDDVKAITQLKPMTVIFYEDGFEDDNVKINAEVILKDHGVEDVRSV